MFCPIYKDQCCEDACALWAEFNKQCAILTIADCMESWTDEDGTEIKVRVVDND